MFTSSAMIAPAIILLVMIASCGDSQETSPHQGRSIDPEHTVVIYDGEQEVTRVQVALARTESERNTGLMDVQEMPFDAGMLFLFDDEQERSFWMVNTPISLDILFLNSDREIVRIQTRTTPYSDRQVTSDVPAQYVLEVNAGFSREFDLREGMHLEWDER